MFKRLALSLLAAFVLVPVAPATAAECQFANGFRDMRDAIPPVVGDCIDNEHTEGPYVVQNTTTGEFFYRVETGAVLFVASAFTWVRSPQAPSGAIYERLVNERFPWEVEYRNGSTSAADTVICPPTAPGRCWSAGAIPASTPSSRQFPGVRSADRSSSSCDFRSEFKPLVDALPDIVGGCLGSAREDYIAQVGRQWLTQRSTTGSLLYDREASAVWFFDNSFTFMWSLGPPIELPIKRLAPERMPWDPDYGSSRTIPASRVQCPAGLRWCITEAAAQADGTSLLPTDHLALPL